MAKLSINEWCEEDRPRERLRDLGAEVLKKEELLAILIGSGNTEETAVELMKRIIDDCSGNLNTLGKKSLAELMTYKGIGEAKAITILAACELGKRRAGETLEERPQFTNSKAFYDFFHHKMQDAQVEEFRVALLNQKMRLLKCVTISKGGISSTIVDIRVVMKEALMASASAMVACHNHPSGCPTPSAEDDRLTERINQAANIMNIRFIDHIVLADGSYYSYHDEGKL